MKERIEEILKYFEKTFGVEQLPKNGKFALNIYYGYDDIFVFLKKSLTQIAKEAAEERDKYWKEKNNGIK
jgi:hypothetical protein